MRARLFQLNIGVLILSLIGFAAPNTVQASAARSMTLEDLVDHSTNIVTGRCVATTTEWNADRTKIVTVARYAIAEDIKGDVVGEIEVETLGGEIGEIGMYVPGMPTFQTGSDDVLFLTNQRTGTFEIVGMSQGKFRISFETVSAPPIVERSLEGMQLVGPRDSRLERQRLSAFVRAVRLALR